MSIEFTTDAILEYHPNAIEATPEEIKEVVEIVSKEEKIKFKMFSRECTMHRKQKMFGQDYKFSGITVKKHKGEMPALIQKCVEFSQKNYPELEANAILANLYGPSDYISPHRDNEGKHAKGKPIIGFSFGEARKLTIKSYKRKRDDKGYVKHEQILEAGSAYVMQGKEFQKVLTHEVGKGSGIRLSLTIREFK